MSELKAHQFAESKLPNATSLTLDFTESLGLNELSRFLSNGHGAEHSEEKRYLNAQAWVVEQPEKAVINRYYGTYDPETQESRFAIWRNGVLEQQIIFAPNASDNECTEVLWLANGSMQVDADSNPEDFVRGQINQILAETEEQRTNARLGIVAKLGRFVRRS